MESVIWPIIIYLNDPDAATNTSTNMTPMAMSDDVKRVLLLYLDKFRTAILKSLSMSASLSFSQISEYPILERIDRFHFTDDLLVMCGKYEGHSQFFFHFSPFIPP